MFPIGQFRNLLKNRVRLVLRDIEIALLDTNNGWKKVWSREIPQQWILTMRWSERSSSDQWSYQQNNQGTRAVCPYQRIIVILFKSSSKLKKNGPCRRVSLQAFLLRVIRTQEVSKKLFPGEPDEINLLEMSAPLQYVVRRISVKPHTELSHLPFLFTWSLVTLAARIRNTVIVKMKSRSALIQRPIRTHWSHLSVFARWTIMAMI